MKHLKPLMRLKPFVRPYLWLILISVSLAIPLAALRLSPAPFVKYLVDDLLVNKQAGRLILFPIFIILLYVVNFVIRFIHYYALRVVVARVNQRVKNKLFDHVLGLSSDYFTSNSIGTLISRVGADPQYIDSGLASLNVLIREPMTFIFLLSYAAYLNWKLTIISVFTLPLLIWLFSAAGKNLKRYIGKMAEENAKLFSQLQESLSGIRIVKSFGLEKYARKKFRERSEGFTGFLLKTAILEEAAHPTVELFTSFAIAAVIFYGGSQVISGTMTSGDLLAFFTAFALCLDRVRTLNDVNLKLHQAAAACERIFEVFDWQPRMYVAKNPKSISSFEREIRFDNVVFAYPDDPEKRILNQISFDVKRGQSLAIVGKSGSGKTSLVNLLPRIFDVNFGRILIDGTDIKEFNLAELRKTIAVVSQDVFLFNDTIQENIRCGRLDASKEEIIEAAKKAYALEFIEASPQGFNTVIGDRGQKLSGGERQRLSIARAFLKEAPILILDEATSSLDTASERAVQKALEDLMANRTTLVIAHRLSTIQNADRIIVMREGKVVETGSHQELLGSEGEYYRLHCLSGSI